MSRSTTNETAQLAESDASSAENLPPAAGFAGASVDQVDALPVRRLWLHDRLVVVGAHGGAGESTIAVAGGWHPSNHSWPRTETGTVDVVLVARTCAHGMTRAALALQQYASSSLVVEDRPLVRLHGLVLVDDAPKGLPKLLRDQLRVLGAGAPKVWRVPWIEAFRVGDTEAGLAHDGLAKVVLDLNQIPIRP